MNAISYICSKKKLLSILIILISMLVYILIDFDMGTPWSDEIFSMAMIRYSFSDIWNATAADVHPPLYYYMLNVFASAFGNSLTTLRIFSGLGVLATFVAGLFLVRRYFGENVSLMFIFLIAFLPVTQFLASDVRMYSWAMFFTFLTTLIAYSIYLRPKFIKYILLLVSALCAAYTHYYALMGVSIVLMILLIIQIRQKIDIKSTLLIIGLFIIGFSFWIPELIKQVTLVTKGYWINTPTPKDVLLLIYYSFSPKEPSHAYTIFNVKIMSIALFYTLLILLLSLSHGIVLYKKPQYKENLQKAGILSLIYLIPLFIGIIISYTIKPIIVPRYMLCLLGPFVLAYAILLVQLINSGKKFNWTKKHKSQKRAQRTSITIMCLFVLLSTARFFSEREYQNNKRIEYKAVDDYLSTKGNDKKAFMGVLVSCSMLGQLEFRYPNNLYLIYSDYKTKLNYKPFDLIEVYELPSDFDFYYIQDKWVTPEQVKQSDDFLNNVQKNYVIKDSLIQEKLKIYHMKTIHRDREQNMQ